MLYIVSPSSSSRIGSARALFHTWPLPNPAFTKKLHCNLDERVRHHATSGIITSALVLILDVQALHHPCIPSCVESPRAKLCSRRSTDNCRKRAEVSGGSASRRTDNIPLERHISSSGQAHVGNVPEQCHLHISLTSLYKCKQVRARRAAFVGMMALRT
jgi:hypothetical protein